MERACELLRTSFLSVKEVMALVGWADESHFVRRFKRVVGVSPTRYRSRLQSSQSSAGATEKANN
jgi:AraC-like DNA-binding protein